MHTARCCYVGTSVLLDISVLHRNSKTTTISCSRLGQCRGCSRLLLYILITISVICPRVSHATSAAANYSLHVGTSGVQRWIDGEGNVRYEAHQPSLMTQRSSNFTSDYRNVTTTERLIFDMAPKPPSENVRKVTAYALGIPIGAVGAALLVFAILKCRERYKRSQHSGRRAECIKMNGLDEENMSNSLRTYTSANQRNAPPTYTDTCVQDMLNHRDEETTDNNQTSSSTDPLNPPTSSNTASASAVTADDNLPSYDDVMMTGRG